MYTVLLYLNDVERGGRTTFFKARVGHEGGIEYRPTLSPPPVPGREGRGLAFFHKVRQAILVYTTLYSPLCTPL